MKKPVLALVLALAIPFGVAACGGGDDDKSDEEQVRDVIELVNAKKKEACDKLSDKYLKDVIGGDKEDCEKQVDQTPENAVKIKTVRVSGDKATVDGDIQGGAGQIFLVKEGDDWKLDDVER